MHPPDGLVSAEELTRWNLRQAINEAMHRTEREFQSHDDNRDGFVSFAEYEPPTWVRAAGKSSSSFYPLVNLISYWFWGPLQINVFLFGKFVF